MNKASSDEYCEKVSSSNIDNPSRFSEEILQQLETLHNSVQEVNEMFDEPCNSNTGIYFADIVYVQWWSWLRIKSPPTPHINYCYRPPLSYLIFQSGHIYLFALFINVTMSGLQQPSLLPPPTIQALVGTVNVMMAHNTTTTNNLMHHYAKIIIQDLMDRHKNFNFLSSLEKRSN